MKIMYAKYKFNIHFVDPIYFSTDPNFIFRSVIGKTLRDLSCIRKKFLCKDCNLSGCCAYAILFETPAAKRVFSEFNRITFTILFETPIKFESIELKGRIAGTHPYVMNIYKSNGEIFDLQDKDNGNIRDFIIEVTALESAIPSFSYFFAAFYTAGKNGLFKERKKYIVVSVETKEELIYPTGDSIRINPVIEKWESMLDNDFDNYKVEIKFLTPFRYVEKGSLSEPVDASHIISSASRRMRILTELYGHNYLPFSFDKRFLAEPFIKVTERNLNWKESIRFSAKQNSLMILGGVVGNINLEGKFSKSMIDMIEGVKIFNIGKNTAFGFGKVDAVVSKI